MAVALAAAILPSATDLPFDLEGVLPDSGELVGAGEVGGVLPDAGERYLSTMLYDDVI